MARIVLTCWGSHGDVDPFLGLGLTLAARGHDITIATIEHYRSLIETAGLAFRAIRPNVNPSDSHVIEQIMDRSRGTDYLLRQLLFPNVRAMFEDVSDAATGADLLVSHPITFATPIVAAHRQIPWASVVLAPASMFSSTDMMVLPPAPWLKSLERFAPWTGRVVMRAVRSMLASWPKQVYQLRQSLGLPRGGNPILEGQHSPTLVLALYSRLLGDPQPDWPPHVVVTGHAFYDAPHGTSLAPELEAFLASGPPPLVFTLGSSVVIIEKEFWRESADATARLGARAVFIAGEGHDSVRSMINSTFPSAARNIVVVNRAPHSLLFPRASTVIHQCGVGTLAQGLRSGAPLLAVPYAHDQPDNAWRACHLGVGRTIQAGRYLAPRVAAELRTLTSEPDFAAAAKRVANVVRSEGGLEAASDAIEHTFALRR